MEYNIRPNFCGAQFPQIAISKHFAETIFVHQEFPEFRVLGILKFRQLNFCENCENYVPQKFGCIRYFIPLFQGFVPVKLYPKNIDFRQSYEKN